MQCTEMSSKTETAHVKKRWEPPQPDDDDRNLPGWNHQKPEQNGSSLPPRHRLKRTPPRRSETDTPKRHGNPCARAETEEKRQRIIRPWCSAHRQAHVTRHLEDP